MIKHSPPHSFLGSSVPWMIMHAVAPNTWCFAPMRFCSPSFLASFATLFCLCASAPLMHWRLQQHLCYRTAFLRSFVCIMPHLCCSICSSSLRLFSHSKTCCLSVCLFFSVCVILCFFPWECPTPPPRFSLRLTNSEVEQGAAVWPDLFV